MVDSQVCTNFQNPTDHIGEEARLEVVKMCKQNKKKKKIVWQ